MPSHYTFTGGRPGVLQLLRVAIVLYLLATAWLPNTILDRISLTVGFHDWLPGWGLGADLLLVASMVCLFVLLNIRNGTSLSKQLIIAVIVIYALASMASAASRGGDRLTMIRSTSIAAAILLGGIASSTLPDVRIGLRIAVIVVAAQAIYTFALYLKGDTLMSGTIPRATGTFQDASATAALFCAFLPYCVMRCMVQLDERMIQRIVITAILGSALALIWLRTSFLAIGVAVVAVGVRASMSRVTILLLAASFIGLVAVTYSVRTSGASNAAAVNRSTGGRIQAWKDGLNIFCERPLTGVGVGALTIQVRQVEASGRYKTWSLAEPKSTFILLLAELGVGGGALALTMGAALWSHFQRPLDHYAEGLLGAWIVIAILSLVDTPVLSDHFGSNVLLGYLIGLTLISGKSEPHKAALESSVRAQASMSSQETVPPLQPGAR